MLVSFGLVRDNNTVKRVYQYTEGWAHMQFEYEGVRVRFNPAPGKKLKDNATRRKDGSLYLPNLGLVTYVEVALPDHQRIISDWYMVEGEAQGRESPTGSDMFHQFEKEVQGVQNSTLNFVVTMWQMEMVHGWYFNHHIFIYLKYFAEGKWKSFSKGLWMVEGSMLEPHMMNNGDQQAGELGALYNPIQSLLGQLCWYLEYGLDVFIATLMSNRLAFCSIFFVAVLISVMAAKRPNDFRVLADYPAACRGGPGAGEGSDMQVASNVCVYTILDGDTAVSGIRIQSNQPGYVGAMYLELNIERPAGGNANNRVYEKTDGAARLQFNYTDVTVNFNPVPGQQTVDKFTVLDDGSLWLPHLGMGAYCDITFPNEQKITEGFWTIDGYAVAKPIPVGSVMMHFSNAMKTGAGGSLFRAEIVMMHLEIPGGWYFNYEFGTDLVYYLDGVRHKVFERAVLATGHMFNKTAN
ncbi:hypothetical protein FOL47_006862 [Perkinsus chesapeaki]|uniref:Uncharacterized protein n=1 Tax=Perkinsus chesapeaki TaxID=330153 RepID=A0A7J6LP34_PERCH|nr:hypothetical protein FOL47_006862 [Perkinsus chesapeaki]